MKNNKDLRRAARLIVFYNGRLREVTLERDFYQKQAQKNWIAGVIATICFGISLTINFVLLGIL